MPQYRALKTFGTIKGKHGTVRTGSVLTLSEKDAAELNRPHPKNRPAVVPYGGPKDPGGPREPPDDRSLPGAPKTKIDPGGDDIDPNAGLTETEKEAAVNKEKDEGNEQAPSNGPSLRVAQRGGGSGRRSSVLPVGHRSPRKT